MNLAAFRDEAGEFLKAIDPADERPVSEIIRMLDEEYAGLKASLGDSARLAHQVYDVLFLLFELAAKERLDLDAEWIRGRQKKQKYGT